MMWFIAAVIVVAALIILAWPLITARRQSENEAKLTTEIDLYNEETKTLNDSIAEGQLTDDEISIQKNDINRRLLERSRASQKQSLTFNQKPARYALLIIGLCLPIIGYQLYSVIGAPQYLTIAAPEPLPVADSDPEQEALVHNINRLVLKVEKRLALFPDEREGWQVIAPVYTKLKSYGKAIKAYQNILRLDPQSIDAHLRLAEVMLYNNNQQINGQITALYQRALTLDPFNIEANFFMIIAEIDARQNEKALARINTLRQRINANNPLHEMLDEQEARIRIANNTNQMMSGVTPENQEMIMGMVQRLDQRLTENPDNGTLDEWQRLVRAYWVLGDINTAQNRLNQGIKALTSSPEKKNTLINFAKTLNIEP